MGRVPDSAENRQWVLITDYAAAREEFGIALPDPNAAFEEFEQYVLQLFDPKSTGLTEGSLISGMDPYFEHRRPAQHLGFDGRNVDQTVTIGNESRIMEIAKGLFNPNATARAIADCAECEKPSSTNYAGASYYAWGKDFDVDLEKRLEPPAFDRQGRGGRILVQDNYVYRTLSHDDMESLIDVAQGDGASLAESEDFTLLNRALSRLKVYSAVLSDQTQRARDFVEGPKLSKAEMEKGGLLRPYSAFASGVGADGGSPYAILVLVHRDDATAMENANLLKQRIEQGLSMATRQPWADSIGRPDVKVEGRMLSATFSKELARQMWSGWAFQKDPLIAHE